MIKKKKNLAYFCKKKKNIYIYIIIIRTFKLDFLYKRKKKSKKVLS